MPESTPPPPGPVASISGERAEVREFIEAHVDEFLTGYRGGGGRPRTVVEAANCYLRKQNPEPIAQWWNGVLETVSRYNAEVMAGKTRAKESPWWFVDGYDTQAFGGVRRRQWGPEDLGLGEREQRIADSWNTPDTEADRLKAVGAMDAGKLLPMPAGPKQAPPLPKCRKCGGEGKVDAPVPYEMVKNWAYSTAQIQKWAKENGTECEDCNGGKKAATA